MRFAFRAQHLINRRPLLDDRPALLDLAVQNAQGIFGEPLPAFLTDDTLILPVIFHKTFKILRPAVLASDTVDLEGQILETQIMVQMPCDRHHFQVQGWILLADGFYIELGMLSVPSGLRSLVTENRSPGPHLHGFWGTGHAVLYIGTHGPCCELRAQRDGIPPSVRERIHLFFNDIGSFSHTPLE